jgi:hypothetical protein
MAEIQLSSQLFQDIQQAVARQHPGADQGTVMQYLAAVMGYMLGNQRQMSDPQKAEFMDELCGFARHVYQDLAKQAQQQQAAQAQAFGYWEPPKQS